MTRSQVFNEFSGVTDPVHVRKFVVGLILTTERGGPVRDQRYSTAGQVKESEKHNLNIDAYRKSDKAIVVRIQANKMTIRILDTDQLIAELEEQRALTERNPGNKPVTPFVLQEGSARGKQIADLPGYMQQRRRILNFVLTISITI